MRVLRYVSPVERLGPDGEVIRNIRAAKYSDGYVWRVWSATGEWMADLTTLDFVRTMLRVEASEATPVEARELAGD